MAAEFPQRPLHVRVPLRWAKASKAIGAARLRTRRGAHDPPTVSLSELPDAIHAGGSVDVMRDRWRCPDGAQREGHRCDSQRVR